MEREQWLEARRKGVGGSDIAAICGLSRWRGPMDVYLDKIGAAGPDDPNEAMYWGSAIEQLLLTRFEQEHDEYWVESGSNELHVHPEHDFCVASYDGLVYATKDWNLEGVAPVAGWEGKTASAYKSKEWEGDAPPLEYVFQVQWYMAVSGLPRWYLSVLIGGQQYREWIVERDDELIDMLLKRAQEFWQLVESRTPPAIDASKATSAVLSALHPAADAVLDPPAALPDDAATLAENYLEAKQMLKLAEEGVRYIENRLKDELGDNAVGLAGGYEITWKPRKRSTFDTTALLNDHPEMQQYRVTTEYRVFGVKALEVAHDAQDEVGNA